MSIVLAGCLCCLGLGCGQEREAEFRTYEQTVADAGPTDPPEESPPEPADPLSVPDDNESAASESPETTDPSEDVVVSEGSTSVGVTPEGDPAGEPTPPADVATTDSSEGETIADETALPTEPREIELLIAEKEFQTEGPEGAVRVSYDDIDLLKVLNMEPVPRSAPSYFPEWLSGLEGDRIRIRGFMYPPPIESGIPVFLLARDNQICCFGKNPMPYDIVPVILREGVTTDYINGRPFDVVGLFHVGVEMNLDDPTKVKTVYYIDDATVIDD